MKKVLILQNKILHYRKPLYNELSKYYDITILHSGNKSIERNDSYREIITPVKKMGPFYLQMGVLKTLRRLNYDVVIAMFDLRWIFNVMAVFCKSGVRFLYWGHRYNKNPLANKLRDLLMRLSDGAILYTNSEVDKIISGGLPKYKIFVANNTFYVKNRVKCYLFEKNSIISVGSIVKRKENDTLIKAFFNIINTIPKNINIVFIGDGPEKENLFKLARKLEIDDRVLFKGEIMNPNILVKFYKNAIISVSFGQAGLSVLHSMAYGVPFITKQGAISSGEITNIRNNLNGIICEGNTKALEISLKKVCSDLEYAKKIGEQAYLDYTKYCTIENMVRGFRNAIDDIKTQQSTHVNYFN